MKHTLINAQEMGKLHPDTFYTPNLAELIEKLSTSNIVTKMWCKVGLEQGERFWVQVIKFENGLITGLVDNDLVLTHEHGLSFEDEITFNPEDVYDWKVYEK